jgi:ribose/xylose/arabinose/galactoside ABC-type transport system permease subunit
MSKSLRQRLMFLIVANAACLAAIYGLLREGSSFSLVLRRAGSEVAPVMLAGLGLTSVIVCGAIDLSIGSILAVSGTLFACLAFRGVAPLWCWLACFGLCGGLSLVNGYAVRWLKLPAIIITLGGLAIYRGLALILASLAASGLGESLAVQDEAYHAPGKRYAGWILLLGIVSAVIWERCGKRPRLWRAIGCSREVCRLNGVDPGRILQSAFFVQGIYLGLASLVYVTRLQVIEPARLGRHFELDVIGAIVLGGTNIFGGEGSVWGTILGASLLYEIGELLVYAGVNPYYQDVIRGGLILLVIGIDCALHRSHKMLEELA